MWWRRRRRRRGWQRTGAKRHHLRSSAEYFPVIFVVAKVHAFKWMPGVFRCGRGGGRRTGMSNVMSGRRWIKFQHISFSCWVRIEQGKGRVMQRHLPPASFQMH